MQFNTIEELILHYQESEPLAIPMAGDIATIRLNKACRFAATYFSISRFRIWAGAAQLLPPVPVAADLKIPFRMTKEECEAALGCDGCETGDFVVRCLFVPDTVGFETGTLIEIFPSSKF